MTTEVCSFLGDYAPQHLLERFATSAIGGGTKFYMMKVGLRYTTSPAR